MKSKIHQAAALAAAMLAFAAGTPASELTDCGLQPALVYDGAAFSDLAGGLRRGSTALGILHLQLTGDGMRLAGIPGLTFHIEEMNVHGGHPSRFAGDGQGVSSLEGPARWTTYEAWIQQNLAGNRLSILLGRYDLNSEFYRLQSAGLFLNSSFGIGPEFSQSGRSGPSIFPETSVGARLAWKPAQNVVVRTAIAGGPLVVAEGAYLFRPAPMESPRNPRFRLGRMSGLPPYTAKVAFGAWHYTATYPDLVETTADGQPVQHAGSSGAYALADVTLYQDATLPARRLSLFGQFGAGDARLNHFARYTGAGIVMSAPWKGRAADEVGVAIAVAHNGGHYAAAQNAAGTPVGKAESALEGSYLAALTPHVAVQPDLQYVFHPDTDRARKNALVAMLRFEVSF